MHITKISDPVYGDIQITHPLLHDLYHSKTIQRLAYIYQGGITAFIKPERNTTRLDHSLGVMALLQHFGASIEEQAAGLIHDAPHTAFSHVVDFVFPNHEHTYHEVHREAFIQSSDLPEILNNHAIDWRWLSEAENFSLLEQPLPALCADRLDYFFRDGLSLGYLDPETIADFLAHLQPWHGQIVATDTNRARQMGERFMALDNAVWCSVQEVGWYAIMARALRAALQTELLSERDFWSTDRVVMQRLRDAQQPDVQRWLNLLRPEVTFARTDKAPDMIVLPKVRVIDPPILLNGTVTPLSQIDPQFAKLRDAYVAQKQGTWSLKITRTL